MVSTDLNKAFDSLCHEVLIGNAIKLGDHATAKPIKLQYQQLKTHVLVQGKLSTWLDLTNGTIQSDPLSFSQSSCQSQHSTAM